MRLMRLLALSFRGVLAPWRLAAAQCPGSGDPEVQPVVQRAREAAARLGGT